MQAPVPPPPPAGFDAIAGQLLTADPDELYRRADAFDAVVAELESVHAGLRRESGRVLEVMDGDAAEAFGTTTGDKLAVLDRSLGTLRDYAPALRRAGDELARSRSVMTELAAQRATYAGTPQAAQAETQFAAAANQVVARVGEVFHATGNALHPLSAVPTGTGGPAPAGTGTTVVPAGAPVVPGTAARVPQQAVAGPPGFVDTPARHGLTVPGRPATGFDAWSPGAPGTVPGDPAGTPADGPRQPVATDVAPLAFGGGVLGAPVGRSAVAPAGTGALQSAPVRGTVRAASLRSAVPASRTAVLGRPATTDGAPGDLTVPAGPPVVPERAATATGPAATDPAAAGAPLPLTSTLSAGYPGAGGSGDGVVGRRNRTATRTPTAVRTGPAGTPDPALERTVSDPESLLAPDPATATRTSPVPLPATATTPTTAAATAGGPAPRFSAALPGGPGPESLQVPARASVAFPGGGPSGGGPSPVLPGGTGPGAGWPVRPVVEGFAGTPSPVVPGSGPGTTGGTGPAQTPSGQPFMPMGGMGGAGGVPGAAGTERERETSLTEDPSAWEDDGVPGVLGRSRH